MNELLFKLKRDGKTVGYMKINPKGKWDKLHPMEDKFMFRPIGLAHENKWYCIGFRCLDFDSIYPFVTKDKNGKDVFADDTLRVPTANKGVRHCKVHWDKYGWFPWTCMRNIDEYIELIEDKND